VHVKDNGLRATGHCCEPRRTKKTASLFSFSYQVCPCLFLSFSLPSFSFSAPLFHFAVLFSNGTPRVDNFLVIRSALAKNPAIPSAKRISISVIAIDREDTTSHDNRCDSILPRIRIIEHWIWAWKRSRFTHRTRSFGKDLPLPLAVHLTPSNLRRPRGTGGLPIPERRNDE